MAKREVEGTFEVVVRDERGLLRRDGLQYVGRTAQREAARLLRQGLDVRVLPYLPINERQVVA